MNATDIVKKGDANPARSGDAETKPSLLGRKSMLIGMAASVGVILSNVAQPSASAAVEPYAGATERGVNALKNGCAGNGTTDDTAALHAVRNAAATLGVPVFLPRGIYLVTSLSLNVTNQCWVLADGAVIKQKAATALNIVNVTAAGVSVRGGTIDGNKANQTAAWQGFAIQAERVTIANVEVTNVFGSGIVLFPTAVGCLIKNNYCHDNGKSTNAASGIYLVGATRTRIIGNRCENNGTAGNEALYDGNGIYLAGGAVVGHNLVANNQCSYNARRGIKIQECGATVTGNTLVLNSCGIGVTVTPNPTNTPTVISGNTIKDSTLQGLQLDNCSFLTITGNTIADSGSHGVGAALNANFITFTGNTVLRSRRNGLNLAHITDWVISGNMIINNGVGLSARFGLVLDASGGACQRVNIVGNTSQNSGTSKTQTHGFVVSSNADRINFVGNMAVTGVAVPFSISPTATRVQQVGSM